MKKALAILITLCLFFLFGKNEQMRSEGNPVCPQETESLCPILDSYSSSHGPFAFNQESKYELSLASRSFRNSGNGDKHFFMITRKLLRAALVKEKNVLQHISETASTFHTLECSALRHEAGYLVFALRKILV